MKKSELRKLIRETIREVGGVNQMAEASANEYVVVDLDRSRGAFYAGEDNNTSPIDPRTGDVDGQWEHITNWNGEEVGSRQGWETNFSTFPDRTKATMWATKFLKGQENPSTGRPFRFQVLTGNEWDKELTRSIKNIGTPRDEQPYDDDAMMLGQRHDDSPQRFQESKNKFTLGDVREIINEAVSEVLYEQSLPPGLPAKDIMTLDQFIQSSNVGEAADMMGAKTTPQSPEDMQSYLGRVKDKTVPAAEKFKMPYVHGSNVAIKNDAGKTYDTEKLKNAIKARPKTILKTNEKMLKSGGDDARLFNIGLPALKGLAVNEKTNEFVVVDTCPGAGACKIYCYAKKGGYVQYKDASMSQTRLLNYLLNDPDKLKTQLEAEIRNEERKSKSAGKQLMIRWHDSGDFFSPDYLNWAYEIARDLPEVKFYAYTKMAGVATGAKPDNFIMNFSMGANLDQEKQIDFSKTKHSTVVPKPMFDQYMLKDEKGKLVRDDKKRMQFKDDAAEAEFKKKLAQKYNVKPDSVITYDEMLKTPESPEKNKYNVIIRPGDGDISASRPDVKGTYLLIH